LGLGVDVHNAVFLSQLRFLRCAEPAVRHPNVAPRTLSRASLQRSTITRVYFLVFGVSGAIPHEMLLCQLPTPSYGSTRPSPIDGPSSVRASRLRRPPVVDESGSPETPASLAPHTRPGARRPHHLPSYATPRVGAPLCSPLPLVGAAHGPATATAQPRTIWISPGSATSDGSVHRSQPRFVDFVRFEERLTK